MTITGKDNGLLRVKMSDGSVALMAQADFDQATAPAPKEAKAVEKAPETKDVKAPKETK